MKGQCDVVDCPLPASITILMKREGDADKLQIEACYRHYAGAYETARTLPNVLSVEELSMAHQPTEFRTCLHVGCGLAGASQTHHWVNGPGWTQLRVDIDPDVKPDIVDDMRTLSKIDSNAYDAVYTSHNLEHLHSYEVLPTLRTFHRVLKSNGLLIVRVPDLGIVCRHIAEGRENEPLYTSPAGEIYAQDMLYGHRGMSQRNSFMQHKCGFTQQGLRLALVDAGFMGEVLCDNFEVQAYVRKVG